jgi:hypothetical protein
MPFRRSAPEGRGLPIQAALADADPEPVLFPDAQLFESPDPGGWIEMSAHDLRNVNAMLIDSGSPCGHSYSTSAP